MPLPSINLDIATAVLAIMIASGGIALGLGYAFNNRNPPVFLVG